MIAEVVVDLQFGSTGKGMVCADLATRRKYDASVRVQSIQAGHTIFYKGQKFKMRTIPCAWVDPEVILVLGPGCFIEKHLLLEEVRMLEVAGVLVRERLLLDYRATYVLDEDREAEQGLDKSMGSTTEGAGASLIRKLWRRTEPTRVCDDDWAMIHGFKVGDSIEFLNRKQRRVLVEGCQGTMLSVHTSPYYPHVTSRECSVAGIIAEAGIAPFDVKSVHGVFRTYPIRVGGNSGPTGEEEISWDEIRRRSGDASIVPERTTVTNRVRRLFEFSDEDFAHALRVNKPSTVYLTFINYVDAGDYGKISYSTLSPKSKAWIERVEQEHEIFVSWLSTGESPEHIIRR